MSETNMMSYSYSFIFFKSVYYVEYLFKTVCLSPNFHLDYTRRCVFTFLPHVGRKASAVEEETK